MRVRKKIKINEVEYSICELTIREIINFFQDLTTATEVEEETTDEFNFLRKEIQTLLDLALEGDDHKVEDLIDLAPSEVKLLYDAFKEVNEVFFATAAQVGVMEVLDDLKNLIQKEFSGLLVNSSKAAITRSLTTDSPTS